MTNEPYAALLQKYPRVFPDWNPEDQEIGDGWVPLVDQLCRSAEGIEGFTIDYMKEKFGYLVVASPCEAAKDLIEQTEAAAEKTCEECGTTENVTTAGPGWILTLCDKCRNLPEPTDHEKLLLAVIEVYAFTLEFVLLLKEASIVLPGVLDSQIKAARDAYKLATGEDVPFGKAVRDGEQAR